MDWRYTMHFLWQCIGNQGSCISPMPFRATSVEVVYQLFQVPFLSHFLTSLDELFLQWSSSAMQMKLTSTWDVLAIAVCWLLWRDRNMRIFQSIATDCATIFAMLCSLFIFGQDQLLRTEKVRSYRLLRCWVSLQYGKLMVLYYISLTIYATQSDSEGLIEAWTWRRKLKKLKLFLT